jgi:phage virion morphogenesis protein
MTASIEFEDDDVQRMLQRLLSATGDMSPALRNIGEILVPSTQSRFETKTGPDGAAWERNSPVTTLRKGRDNPLFEHGDLSRQIHDALIGDDTLEVGSSLPYAVTHQFGAKMGEFGRYSQIGRVRKYGLGTFQGSAGTQKGFPIPWGDIPARPFLGISDDDKASILDEIQAHIEDAL